MLLACLSAILPQSSEAAKREAVHKLNYFQSYETEVDGRQALRIEIGAGGGQNWWCVVFPPLCLGSVSETTQETALEAGLTENQVSLMTGEDEGYVVKFKAVELLEQFKGWLEGR